MAVLHCRWKRVLCCLCASCLCVLLAMIFVLVTVSIAVNKQMSGHGQFSPTITRVAEKDDPKPEREPEPKSPVKKSELPIFFIAPGAIRTRGFSATPEVFWDKKYQHAFWNLLQKSVDSHFRDILSQVSTQIQLGPLEALLLPNSLYEQKLSAEHGLFSLPEQLQNYVHSMNTRTYPVLLRPRGPCGDGDSPDGSPLLLLAIRTSDRNYRTRQLIRNSWGTAGWVRAQGGPEDKRGVFVSRVFLMGTDSELQSETSELLHLENLHYRDILQWDMRDTPLNATVRQLLFWNWFSDSCGHTTFVFETNDQMFVNTRALVSLLLEQLENSGLEDFMIGHVRYGAKPDRSSASQEFIPEAFYKGRYPSYALSAGRLSSAQLLRRLHQVSHTVHLFPIEEVYVGLCLFRLNLSPTHHPGFLPSDWTKEQEQESCAVHKVALLHTDSVAHLLELLMSFSPSCINKTVAPIRDKEEPVLTERLRKHVF